MSPLRQPPRRSLAAAQCRPGQQRSSSPPVRTAAGSPLRPATQCAGNRARLPRAPVARRGERAASAAQSVPLTRKANIPQSGEPRAARAQKWCSAPDGSVLTDAAATATVSPSPEAEVEVSPLNMASRLLAAKRGSGRSNATAAVAVLAGARGSGARASLVCPLASIPASRRRDMSNSHSADPPFDHRATKFHVACDAPHVIGDKPRCTGAGAALAGKQQSR